MQGKHIMWLSLFPRNLNRGVKKKQLKNVKNCQAVKKRVKTGTRASRSQSPVSFQAVFSDHSKIYTQDNPQDMYITVR